VTVFSKLRREADVTAVLTEIRSDGTRNTGSRLAHPEQPLHRQTTNNKTRPAPRSRKVINCIDALLTKECFIRKIARTRHRPRKRMISAVENSSAFVTATW